MTAESINPKGFSKGDLAEEIAPEQALETIDIEHVPEKPDLEDFEEFNNGFAKNRVCIDNNSAAASSSLDVDNAAPAKKKRRKTNFAELKQNCSRPDVVEMLDATAKDPELLVSLKSYRNTVPVPRHWSQKRRFLKGKRGIEKQPYQLPDYAATGIEKVRQASLEEKEDRMEPKMGKMYIDYQVLHDAFYKYQTKPNLTTHGDLYYEGKELEVKPREMKPAGMLLQEPKEALGLPGDRSKHWGDLETDEEEEETDEEEEDIGEELLNWIRLKA